MKTTKMYKFTDVEGNETVSIDNPNVPYEERVLLVAGDKKLITEDGNNFYHSRIVRDDSGWYEIDDPNPPTDDREEFESEEGSDEVQSSE